MASKPQRTNPTMAKNFPKGSYSSYNSFLKQYSANKSTKPSPPPKPIVDNLTLNSNKSENVHAENSQVVLNLDNFNLEKLLAMSNGDIEFLDVNVLRKFIELLNKENKISEDANYVVDKNNNDHSNLTTEDIEMSKQTLVDSLKAQLARYKRD